MVSRGWSAATVMMAVGGGPPSPYTWRLECVTRNVDLPAWYTEAHGEREAVAKEQARLL